jgi:hypothetical protein
MHSLDLDEEMDIKDQWIDQSLATEPADETLLEFKH